MMRNFNNDEIDKYERASKTFISKFRNKLSQFPLMSLRGAIFGVGVISCGYLLYRVYDHSTYRKNNYIDMFKMRGEVISRVRRMDLWHKIVSGSF